MLAAGLAPAAAARQIEFTLGIGPDQFLEIAKFRAARRLWARVLEECGVPAEDRHSATYGVTTGRMITSVDPWVNMLRVTTATFAAGTGGADGVTVTPFDRALGEPGELGRRIARNTQIVLQEESSLGRIADPVAGSYYGEALTDEVARSAWEHFNSIESEGGALAALRSGLIVNAVAEEADRREYDLVHRVRLMTGINEFPLLGDDGTETEPADTTALAKLDAARLAERPAISSLAGLADAAPGERLKQATAAATAGARIDEIFSAFAGETYSQPKLEVRPDSLPIEVLRNSVENHIAAGGDAPRIFLACTGTIASHVALANWAKSFFEVGGIETVPSGHLPDNEAQAMAFRDGGFTTACVCAGRKETPDDIADLVGVLRAAGAEYIYLPKPSAELAEAAEAGRIRWANLREVVRVATPQTEEFWTQAALTRRSRVLCRMVRRALDGGSEEVCVVSLGAPPREWACYVAPADGGGGQGGSLLLSFRLQPERVATPAPEGRARALSLPTSWGFYLPATRSSRSPIPAWLTTPRPLAASPTRLVPVTGTATSGVRMCRGSSP